MYDPDANKPVGARCAAIVTGALVDVTYVAVMSGFVVPVALTRAAWDKAVADVEAELRLAALEDVLQMTGLACGTTSGAPGSRAAFVLMQMHRAGGLPRIIELYVDIEPGDAGEAVVIVKLPTEG